ncbi:MAG TPA: alpha/beta hydrolase [Marmoricola sp.]|nr:alpha/beta hydrolase [Marmoricola sp.]
MSYERWPSSTGAGPSIVLIHGIGHRRQAWRDVVPLLSDDFDIITVDLPGHGESPDIDLDGRSAKDAVRAELETLLDHLGVTKPVVVGNSLGGMIALEAATDQIASSVVCLSPAGFWRNPIEFAYIRSLFAAMIGAGRLVRPIAPLLAETTIGRTIMFSWLAAHPTRVRPDDAVGDLDGLIRALPTLRGLFKQAYSFDAEVSPEVPVTIAWSAQDRVLWPGEARRAQRLIPHATVFELEGCGHVPMLDDPELVAQTIRDHIASLPRHRKVASPVTEYVTI